MGGRGLILKQIGELLGRRRGRSDRGRLLSGERPRNIEADNQWVARSLEDQLKRWAAARRSRLQARDGCLAALARIKLNLDKLVDLKAAYQVVVECRDRISLIDGRALKAFYLLWSHLPNARHTSSLCPYAAATPQRSTGNSCEHTQQRIHRRPFGGSSNTNAPTTLLIVLHMY
jgi:hypothetical protein